MARIAVIIPIYNASDYLKDAIESILNQDYPHFRIYAVNDGSTDNSLEILESFKDDRLSIINKPNNSGIVDTLNLGIEKSSEPLIARMDADDISLPDRFEKQVSFLDRNPEVGIVGGQIELFGHESGFWNVKNESSQIKALHLFRNSMVHPTVMMRRSLLTDHNLKYEKGFPHQEDYMLWYRLLNKTEFANLDEVVLKYRREGQNLTEQNRKSEQTRVTKLFDYVLKDLEIDATEEELILHYFGFSGWRVPLNKKSLKKYKHHLKKILIQNKKIGKYPHKALKKVIKERWDDSFAAMLKAGKKPTLNYWWVGRRVSIRQLRAFLVYNLKPNK